MAELVFKYLQPYVPMNCRVNEMDYNPRSVGELRRCGFNKEVAPQTRLSLKLANS